MKALSAGEKLLVRWLGGAASGCSSGLLVVARLLFKMIVSLFFFSLFGHFQLRNQEFIVQGWPFSSFLEMGKLHWFRLEGPLNNLLGNI